MSIVSEFTKTTPLTAGQNFISPVADLKTFNSLTSQVYLEWVGGSEVTLIVFLFSSDGVNFDTRDEFSIENGIGKNVSMPIHARYCKYEVSHLGPTDMTSTRISAAVHEESHENIDVNVNLSEDSLTATITNEFNLEATQQQVKSVLDNINTNTTRVKTTDNVADAIPVRLVCGIGGEFYNPLRAIGNDLSVYLDDVNPDVAVNSGLSTKALQETGNASLTSIDSKIVTCDTDDVGEKLDTLSGQATTQISYLTSIDGKITEVNTADVSITSSVLPIGASTSALQTSGNDYLNNVVLQTTDTNTNLTTANTTLDNIKLDTANLVRVAPTDNNVQQAIPVRLMVGTSGSAFNGLRSVNGDLSVFVDDMNADAVNNSGMAKATLQTDGNNSLTTISNTLTTMDGVLDDISLNTLSIYNLEKRTFNLPRSSIVLHNSVAVSADTTSTQFIMGDNDDDLTSKDIYNTIQLNGRVPHASSYSCVLEFSSDGTYWFSDHIEPDIKRLGTSAYSTFSLTRTNICSRYARVYHLQAATELFLQASLMRY